MDKHDRKRQTDKTAIVQFCFFSVLFFSSFRISLDEGKKWGRHSFSSAPLYVDGVLMEPESDNHIIT